MYPIHLPGSFNYHGQEIAPEPLADKLGQQTEIGQFDMTIRLSIEFKIPYRGTLREGHPRFVARTREQS